jgi:ubiquinone/menaquinone biosynthesis C-methylase UbiE
MDISSHGVKKILKLKYKSDKFSGFQCENKSWVVGEFQELSFKNQSESLNLCCYPQIKFVHILTIINIEPKNVEF